MPQPEDHFIDIALDAQTSVSLRYWKMGRGRPLLLLHGLGAASDVWRLVLPDLARDYMVYAVDFPGHGLSSRVDDFSVYHVDRMLYLLEQFVAACVPQPFDLMASSAGGQLAVMYVLRHPQQVERLILVSPTGFGRRIGWHMRAVALFPVGELVLSWPAISLMERLYRQGLLFRESGSGDGIQAIARAFFTYYKMPGTTHAVRHILRTYLHRTGLKNPFTQQDLAAIDHPTLIVWGTDDRVLSVEQAQVAHAWIRHSKLVIIEGAGHGPMAQTPQIFLEHVLAFLADAIA